MNIAQRNHISEMPKEDDFESICCDEVETGVLPEEMLEAVQQGEIQKVQRYLAKDLDVNAKSDDEETLLSRACATGQLEVLELLLKCPNIHLNLSYEDHTPLMRASHNGHTECAKRILTAPVKCRLRLEHGWSIIVKVLKEKPHLSQHLAFWLLAWAGYKGQWEAVQLILQTDHHIPGENLYTIVMQAINQNRWDIVNEVLKRNFYNKNEVLNEILCINVNRRCWEKVQEYLKMMDKEFKLEVPLVEAALDGMVDEVQRLLTEQGYDPQILNSCLLVAASGGTNDSVTQLLMASQNTYTHRTFADALFLASLGKHSEMFSALLSNSEASYSFHDLCRAHRVLEIDAYNSMTRLDYEPLINCLVKLKETKAKGYGLFPEVG